MKKKPCPGGRISFFLFGYEEGKGRLLHALLRIWQIMVVGSCVRYIIASVMEFTNGDVMNALTMLVLVLVNAAVGAVLQVVIGF